jgi:hypothetical protein
MPDITHEMYEALKLASVSCGFTKVNSAAQKKVLRAISMYELTHSVKNAGWPVATTIRGLVDTLAHYNTSMRISPITIEYVPSVGDKPAYLDIKPSL